MVQEKENIGAMKQGVVFGMGNPLLDILAKSNEELLKKYHLEKDNAILAEEKHLPLYEELFHKPDTEYAPGGSVQNSFKIIQWILQTPSVTTFMGSIGNDKYGDIMRLKMNAFGINALYQIQDEEATGTCAVLVDKDNRSLCANLAAAKSFTKDFLNEPDNFKWMLQADYYYISGYFLAVSPPSIMQVAQHAFLNDKMFMMNISATYLCKFYKDPMMDAFPYIDLLFGNESEILAFAEEHQFPEKDLAAIAMKMCALPKKNKLRARIVVVTRDENPTILIKGNSFKEYPVVPIDQDKIVDTNGAGDAFVGGFLSQLIQGKNLERCLDYAHKAAYVIIQRSGCTFPEDANFDDQF